MVLLIVKNANDSTPIIITNNTPISYKRFVACSVPTYIGGFQIHIIIPASNPKPFVFFSDAVRMNRLF